ncbi:MAG TPA: hypothetical protein VF993_16735, partial [Myxococcales bacterium]
GAAHLLRGAVHALGGAGNSTRVEAGRHLHRHDVLAPVAGGLEALGAPRAPPVYDRKWLGPLARLVPDALGWNLAICAVKR